MHIDSYQGYLICKVLEGRKLKSSNRFIFHTSFQPESTLMRPRRFLFIAVLLAVLLSACNKEEPAAPAIDTAPSVQAAEAITMSMEERMASGRKLYAAHCAACHQADGQGLAGAFPPLAGSDYLASGGPAIAINVVLNGLTGPIKVNGKDYSSVMPNMSYLSDSDVADVVTYVFNSWGNPGGEVNSAEVAAAR